MDALRNPSVSHRSWRKLVRREGVTEQISQVIESATDSTLTQTPIDNSVLSQRLKALVSVAQTWEDSLKLMTLSSSIDLRAGRGLATVFDDRNLEGMSTPARLNVFRLMVSAGKFDEAQQLLMGPLPRRPLSARQQKREARKFQALVQQLTTMQDWPSLKSFVALIAKELTANQVDSATTALGAVGKYQLMSIASAAAVVLLTQSNLSTMEKAVIISKVASISPGRALHPSIQALWARGESRPPIEERFITAIDRRVMECGFRHWATLGASALMDLPFRVVQRLHQEAVDSRRANPLERALSQLQPTKGVIAGGTAPAFRDLDGVFYLRRLGTRRRSNAVQPSHRKEAARVFVTLWQESIASTSAGFLKWSMQRNRLPRLTRALHINAAVLVAQLLLYPNTSPSSCSRVANALSGDRRRASAFGAALLTISSLNRHEMVHEIARTFLLAPQLREERIVATTSGSENESAEPKKCEAAKRVLKGRVLTAVVNSTCSYLENLNASYPHDIRRRCGVAFVSMKIVRSANGNALPIHYARVATAAFNAGVGFPHVHQFLRQSSRNSRCPTSELALVDVVRVASAANNVWCPQRGFEIPNRSKLLALWSLMKHCSTEELEHLLTVFVDNPCDLVGILDGAKGKGATTLNPQQSSAPTDKARRHREMIVVSLIANCTDSALMLRLLTAHHKALRCERAHRLLMAEGLVPLEGGMTPKDVAC